MGAKVGMSDGDGSGRERRRLPAKLRRRRLLRKSENERVSSDSDSSLPLVFCNAVCVCDATRTGPQQRPGRATGVAGVDGFRSWGWSWSWLLLIQDEVQAGVLIWTVDGDDERAEQG